MGMLSESLEALEKAIESGYDDLEHLVNDSDLDGVKDEDGYKALIHKLKKSSRKECLMQFYKLRLSSKANLIPSRVKRGINLSIFGISRFNVFASPPVAIVYFNSP